MRTSRIPNNVQRRKKAALLRKSAPRAGHELGNKNGHRRWTNPKGILPHCGRRPGDDKARAQAGG